MSTSAFIKHLHRLPDFRPSGKCRYRLGDLLLLGLCTYLCNGQDYEDMVIFTQARAGDLADLLDLRGRIPSHDTFERAFSLLDPRTIERCFGTWSKVLTGNPANVFVAADGLRRARASRVVLRRS